ncbi:cystathionine beta-lyase [Burkholderiaceae bacterium FT117]|uniref:cystathionine beta-lyase n=1 Tax=Zeimonas sediminis TaxID=2944268 RepID=UPI002342D550|nr:cystathionine beta-lyase [Zeimonas sediminis]MCM5571001.1 cystathionine beta-lyase [Zeimonas sediminis]
MHRDEPPTDPLSDGPAPRTRVVDAGRRFDDRIATANLPAWRASTVLFDSLAHAEAAGQATGRGERHATTYATAGTPGTLALADALAEVEAPGHACRAALMPSGLSAISTALLAFLSPGDHLLVSDSVYGPTRAFCDGMLSRYGVRTEYYDPTIGAGIAQLIRPETRIVYLESPGSYTFEIQDVPAICVEARARGVLTMIDNAWASPVFSRPFDWGVDASILPLTKYWGGHSDLLMGAVVIREEHWPRLWTAVRQLGVCVGGDDAWLVLRGLRTAEVRMRAHEQSALRVARWLAGRPEVASVLHPALESHPQHALWKRDFGGSSGLFSFELRAEAFGADAAGAQRALAALCEGRRHFGIGYSWGGFESLIMPAKIGSLRTARPWQGGPLVRLHVGLEEPADLIADLEAGFEAMRRVRDEAPQD